MNGSLTRATSRAWWVAWPTVARTAHGVWIITCAPIVWAFDLNTAAVVRAEQVKGNIVEAEKAAKIRNERIQRHRELWWLYLALAVLPPAVAVWAGYRYAPEVMAVWSWWLPAALLVAAYVAGYRARPNAPGPARTLHADRHQDMTVALGKAVQRVGTELAADQHAVRYATPTAVRTKTGIRVEPILPGGVTVAELRQRQDRLASLLGRQADALVITRGSSEAHAIIDVLDQPLTSQPPVPWAHAHATHLDVWLPIEIGVDALGTPVLAPFVGTNWIVAGLSGSGKSTFLRTIGVDGALDDLTEVHIFDLGGAVDFADLEPVCATYQVGHTRDDLARLDAHLTYLEGQVEQRRRTMDAHREDFPEAKVTRAAAVKHTMPWIVTYIDECHLAMHDKARRSRITELATVMRKYAMSFRFATPYPTDEVFPAPLTQVCAGRVAFAVETPAASNVVLGPGMVGQGYDASALTLADAGTAWVKTTGAPVLTRFPHVTRADVAGKVAGLTADRPVPLPTLVEHDEQQVLLWDELRDVWPAGVGSSPAAGLHLDEIASLLGSTVDHVLARAHSEGVKVTSVLRRRDGAPVRADGIKLAHLDYTSSLAA